MDSLQSGHLGGLLAGGTDLAQLIERGTKGLPHSRKGTGSARATRGAILFRLEKREILCFEWFDPIFDFPNVSISRHGGQGSFFASCGERRLADALLRLGLRGVCALEDDAEPVRAPTARKIVRVEPRSLDAPGPQKPSPMKARAISRTPYFHNRRSSCARGNRDSPHSGRLRPQKHLKPNRCTRSS
jgi:hypothetical protein